MSDVEKKLEIIIDKLEDIESRVKKIEGETEEIHQFVPFVSWLETLKNKLSLTSLMSSRLLAIKEETPKETPKID